MKTNLIQTGLLVAAVLTLPAVVQAQFNYATNNGTITITGYSGPGGAVNIPATINGLPVSTIGDVAFDGAALTSVTIPDSVTNIGDYGFADCSSLKSVIIGNGVTTIGNYAFSFCEELSNIMMGNSVRSIGQEAFNSTAFTNIAIPDSVTTIGYGAFDNARLTSMTIPDSVTNIGDYAFQYCINLKSVTIPDSATSIGGGEFYYCFNLTIVTIPNSVTNIASLAFSQSGLRSITIPGSVVDIGDDAFLDCLSLSNITVAVQNPAYSSLNGVLFDKKQTTLVVYPCGLGGSYTIPDGAITIGDHAFDYCESLTSVTIPNSVITIGDYAFSGESFNTLTNVTMGNNVASIGNYAFFSDYCLTSITIPDSVTNLGESAFNGCFGLTHVTIGSGVTTIGDDAFDACGNLTSVTIPNGVTIIGDGAFAGCFFLTAITVAPGNPAYSSVNGVLLDKSQTTLILCPPANPATSYTIPGSVMDIEANAFIGCDNLASVTIPASVTNIGDSDFFDCHNLTSVFFTGDVPSVGPSTFGNDFWGVYFPDQATAFYLPGTTGWADFSAATGLPTALWLPQVQTNDASFGVQNNQFGFNINWASGQTVVVEACTDLANPAWQPVQTNTLTSNSVYFSDPQPANLPGRFYRLRSP